MIDLVHEAGSVPICVMGEDHILAQAIVDTIREPLLVLDHDLHVLNASRSYYRKFGLHPKDTVGRMLYDLGDGEWDIPALRSLLNRIIPDNSVMEDFEVEHSFARIGRRSCTSMPATSFMKRRERRIFFLRSKTSPTAAPRRTR